MSGEKCAQARLTSAAQEELERALAESRQLAEMSAQNAKVREEIRLFKKDLSSQAQQYMGKEYESFTEAENALTAAENVYNERLEAARRHSAEVAGKQRTAEEMTRVAEEIKAESARVEEARGQLHEATGALRTTMRAIRENIRERVLESEREELIQKERRSVVSSLIKEVEERQKSDFTLQWVRADVDTALGVGRHLLGRGGQISQGEVEAFSATLEKLKTEGKDAELENRRRWEIAQRLHRAFSESGFEIIQRPGSVDSVGSNDIRFTHKTLGGELHARIKTIMPLDRSIHLHMEGISGKEDISLGRDENCSNRLNQIIARAKELGLIIESISGKDPDGFWRSIYQADSKIIIPLPPKPIVRTF